MKRRWYLCPIVDDEKLDDEGLPTGTFRKKARVGIITEPGRNKPYQYHAIIDSRYAVWCIALVKANDFSQLDNKPNIHWLWRVEFANRHYIDKRLTELKVIPPDMREVKRLLENRDINTDGLEMKTRIRVWLRRIAQRINPDNPANVTKVWE